MFLLSPIILPSGFETLGLFHGLGFSRVDKDLEVDCPRTYPSFLSFVKISGPADCWAGTGLEEVTWQPKYLSHLVMGK